METNYRLCKTCNKKCFGRRCRVCYLNSGIRSLAHTKWRLQNGTDSDRQGSGIFNIRRIKSPY